MIAVTIPPMASAIAFWSYAHEDDHADQGAILHLADRIKDEYSLMTGHEITIFVDRDDIRWGQEWRERIRSALVQTTFFIALLSPRYFQRPECRKELLDFAGQAQGLGILELILPILYTPVPALTDDNPDEAVALAARMQYADWTQVRLRDESSEEHRQAVHELASRLATIEHAVAERQLVRETKIAVPATQGAGLGETLTEIGRLLPDWRDAVETDPIVDAQSSALLREFDKKRSRLTRRQAGVRIALTVRQANEMAPLADRELKLAEIYASRTVELNPLVLAAIRAAEMAPDARSALAPLEEAVGIAIERLRSQSTGTPIDEWAAARAGESRLMGQLASVWRRSNQLRDDANLLVERWAESLGRLDPASEEDS
jgi:hypothetical protein